MRKRRKKIVKFIFILTGTIVFVILLVTSLMFLLVYTGYYGTLPGKTEITSIRNEEASLVFSVDDELIGKIFASNRTNISLNDIPEHFKNAVIATEDRRFYEHKGYDTRSYARVIVRTILIRDPGGGGGSTITQQLVKNLYGRKDFGWLSIPVNKIREAIIARRFEKYYSKNEIFLLYFNTVPFGEDLYGVESASQRYFNKSASELKIQESAVLAGMLKANTLYNPKLNPQNALHRRNTVLNLMKETGYIEEHEEMAEEYLVPFQIPEEIQKTIECPPFHMKGIKGFLFRLFGNKSETEKEIDEDSLEIDKDKNKKSFSTSFSKKRQKIV